MEKEFVKSVPLPLIEEFYSLQGEGQHTGKAAYFIRIGGCDIGCRWCDSKISWNAEIHPGGFPEKIIANAASSGSGAIVVTGGEPLLYDLTDLCRLARENHLQTFLESSGAYSLSGDWDWICLSPKKQKPPRAEIYARAGELKVIIFQEEDLLWAEECAEKVSPECRLFLQPEWSKRTLMTPILIAYIKANPKWQLSVQLHKFLMIP